MKKITLIFLFALLATLLPTVAFAQEDLTPPELLDVSFEPEVIDTSKGPQTITVTVHVVDDLSGLYYMSLDFRKAGTTQTLSVNFNPDFDIVKLIEGDINDGWYIRTATLPQYAAFGEWEMYRIGTSDRVGNTASLRKPENEEEALRGTDQWPSLFNGFVFSVGASDAPVQGSLSLFLPTVMVR